VYGYGRIDALAAVKKALSVTSINESVDPTIQIYPLAGHQQLYISTEFGKEIFNLSLFDMYGREILNTQVDQSISSINLPSLPNGMYIYTLANKEKMTKGILWINQNR
jgi:hypothetical protein